MGISKWGGKTLGFRVYDRLIESDVILIGRGWGWERETLELLDKLDPKGFAIVEVDHPRIRWVLVRKVVLGLDYQQIANVMVGRYGWMIPERFVGHVRILED